MTENASILSHLIALAQMTGVFVSLATSYFGWGKIASFPLGINWRRAESLVQPIWLGWAFTLLIFQGLHFFAALTGNVVIPVFLAGVLFAAPQIAEKVSHPRNHFSLGAVTAGILFLTIIAWVGSRAMLPPEAYDSGLYHLNAIRWICSYPIVPGLGNLHDRLAFNQSFFTYAAALNFYPYYEHGRSLANSFLLILTLATITPSLVSVFQQPSLLTKSHPFLYVADLFVLPILMFLAVLSSSDGLASPTPNMAACFLQIVMFVMLLHALPKWGSVDKQRDYTFAVLSILAASSITIKLSNLAFSAVIIGFSWIYSLKSTGSFVRSTARTFLPFGLILLVWGIRGFILSGLPLFPSTIGFGYIPVDWAMPYLSVVNTANWVYSWARQPYTDWHYVLGSWKWLGPWFHRVAGHIGGVVYPLGSCFCLGLAIFVVRYFTDPLREHCRRRYSEWSILTPLIIGLIYWFFTAPDPGFAHAIFWLLSLSFALLLLLYLQPLIPARKFGILICVVFVVSNLHFFAYAVINRSAFESVSLSGWRPVKKVHMVPQKTSSGLMVYVPESGDQSWDGPLLSAPSFDSNLSLRDPKRVASGFKMN